jgi:cytochrome c oxidase subunit 2
VSWEAQSALVPHGPDAERIATLAWTLFGLCGAVLVLVLLALWIALRGAGRVRAWLASERAVEIGGIAFPVVVLAGLLVYGIWTTQAAFVAPEQDGALSISVSGEQWWWRIGYERPVGGGTIASANEVRIPVGRDVVFTLTAADVIHSFWIPSLGGKVDMIPGTTNRLRLSADRVGVYRGQCAEYCGGPHALMAFHVVAMPEAEFDAWLDAEAGPAAPPANDEAVRGQALFVSAGCGACHTVRGTEAEGTIGPDLTHLGSRRSVGIDTLPMTAENVARFIADGQHIKPNNRMPPFRIFSEAELGAVAAYLAGLE